MEVVELRVRMDCNGCERKVRKALSKLKGVDTVDVDLKQGKVSVTGYVDRKKVLKAVRSTGKSAELVMPASVAGTYNPYMKESEKFARTYNYKKHGYNVVQGYKNPATIIPRDGVAVMFSDDNPNSCSIM